MLVAHQELHDLQGGGVPLALEHHLVPPLSRPVGCEEMGRGCAPGTHEVVDIPSHGLGGGVVLPAALPGDLLELLVEHLPCAQVGGELLVEPDILNDRPLLRGQAGEGVRLLRLPAECQGPEVVPALPVLPFQLQGPGVGLQHLCLVAVEALRADPQPHGEPGSEVGALLRPGVVDKLLNHPGRFDGLVVCLLVALYVVIQVGGHIPGNRLRCSAIYDYIPPVYFLGGPPCLPRLGRQGGDGDQHLIFAAALAGLGLGVVLLGAAFHTLLKCVVQDTFKSCGLLQRDICVLHCRPSLLLLCGHRLLHLPGVEGEGGDDRRDVLSPGARPV